jgi:hypothetical protein
MASPIRAAAMTTAELSLVPILSTASPSEISDSSTDQPPLAPHRCSDELSRSPIHADDDLPRPIAAPDGGRFITKHPAARTAA